MHVIPSLNMANLLANDAPLLSPSTNDWDHARFSPSSALDGFGLELQYPLSPTPSHAMSTTSSQQQSPIPAAMMLRGRLSPDYSDSDQQMCVPTHQVFDYPPASVSPAPQPETPEPAPRVNLTVNDPPSLIPAKRSSSAAPSSSKKRATERVSTKDFIPPDVSGLSKREARLVKNRAAAFLSRQRKREEFENMEVRVAELEQENARLLALANQGSKPEVQEDLVSEVELLRRQLAEAQDRERELNEELSRKEAAGPQPVKMEMMEDSPLPSRSGSVQPQMKSSASLGLMVLLCALPSLLSLPTQSALPTSFSFPLSESSVPSSSSSFDLNSFMPGDFDWSLNGGGSIMDLDLDDGRLSALSSSAAKRLEFVDVDSEALGLSGLDISFDAKAAQDGKIRVRIHPPASSAPPTSAPSPDSHSDNGDDQSMYGGSDASGPTSSESSSSLAGALGSMSKMSPDADPFLGIGGDIDFGSLFRQPGMSVDASNSQMSFPDLDFGDAFGAASTSGRKRVRIALKTLPGEGAEGGEWEVQLC